MATSAFRSTTKRTPIAASPPDDSSSSTRSPAPRRSRSLSRFSHRLPHLDAPSSDAAPAPAPRERFVNAVRGSAFPEISLDDLAVDFFSSGAGGDRRGRSDARDADASSTLSQRRGRSVARHNSGNGSAGNLDRRSSVSYTSARGRAASENHHSRRRRSLSVVRCPISDSESDLDHPHQSLSSNNLKNLSNGRNGRLLSGKPASAPRQGLQRSMSQIDFKPCDGDSSQSSALTDDEVRDNYSAKVEKERRIRAVYGQRKPEHQVGDNMKSELYQAMREEVRHAVVDLKRGIEEVMSKGTYDPVISGPFPLESSDVIQAVSIIRRNYSNKLEQSEKRKQDLLAEIVMEEQRGKELSEIVRDLLPEPNNSVTVKTSRTRRRSNDRSRMSKRLSEEAERYIEDFISNVEDTDISSLDGERSDTSSTLGTRIKMETLKSPAPAHPLPEDTDGVMLPWLQWETSHDVSPQSSCKKMGSPATPVSTEAKDGRDQSGYSASSRGSWNPDLFGAPSTVFREPKLHAGESPISSKVDLDNYLMATSDEDYLFERWMQKERISSGGLLMCNNFSPFF